MELGAVCIDLGGGATSVAVFGGGSLRHVDSLPVGGIRVTNDIAVGLSTTVAGAERIKTLHGSAIASARDDREMIEAPHRGGEAGGGSHYADRSMLTGIISPRVEETLEMVRDRLRAARVQVDPGAGIVLTGGASQLAGVREVAIRVFDRPVRLGKPRRAPFLADAASGPAFCAAAGVLQRAAFGPREAVGAKALAGVRGPRDPSEMPAGALGRAVVWLRENL
jgi:cell division protein FtsA